MMRADDRDYFLKRASQEEEAARDAASLSARARHEELASLYRLKAQQLVPTEEDATPGAIVSAFIPAPERLEIGAG